jgi:hypothetical protein
LIPVRKTSGEFCPRVFPPRRTFRTATTIASDNASGAEDEPTTKFARGFGHPDVYSPEDEDLKDNSISIEIINPAFKAGFLFNVYQKIGYN